MILSEDVDWVEQSETLMCKLKDISSCWRGFQPDKSVCKVVGILRVP